MPRVRVLVGIRIPVTCSSSPHDAHFPLITIHGIEVFDHYKDHRLIVLNYPSPPSFHYPTQPHSVTTTPFSPYHRIRHLLPLSRSPTTTTEYPRYPDPDPNLELHSAAASGNVGLVHYAITHGQPVNSVLHGVLPLHAACSGGSSSVVKMLIERGADVNAPRLPRRYSDGKKSTAPSIGAAGKS